MAILYLKVTFLVKKENVGKKTFSVKNVLVIVL